MSHVIFEILQGTISLVKSNRVLKVILVERWWGCLSVCMNKKVFVNVERLDHKIPYLRLLHTLCTHETLCFVICSHLDSWHQLNTTTFTPFTTIIFGTYFVGENSQTKPHVGGSVSRTHRLVDLKTVLCLVSTPYINPNIFYMFYLLTYPFSSLL